MNLYDNKKESIIRSGNFYPILLSITPILLFYQPLLSQPHTSSHGNIRILGTLPKIQMSPLQMI